MAFMAACGTRSPVFIDHVIADRSSRMTFKVYKAVYSAQIQPNATKLIQQRKMDNHPNHKTKAIKEFVMVKKNRIFLYGQVRQLISAQQMMLFSY